MKILTDKDLIAIDQDEKCAPCRRIKTTGLCDILVKPLANGEAAVCFFNKAPKAMQMTTSLKAVSNMAFVGLPLSADGYTCTDLWAKTSTEVLDALSAEVPSHGVKVYRVKAK